jgi:hypothetical protein
MTISEGILNGILNNNVSIEEKRGKRREIEKRRMHLPPGKNQSA